MTQEVKVPSYRYLIAKVKDGSFVMEVPFNNVSWERKIVTSGSFSGSIAVPGTSLGGDRVTNSEDHFDLYNSTLPGKNAIYIMRDEVLVWGGIIWSREYDINSRTLNVNALELTSYLHHRVLWKTFTVLDDGNTTIKDMLETLITATTTDQIDQASIAVASDVHNMINSYAKNNGSSTTTAGTVVTITTEEIHGFAVDDVIVINNVPLFDGTRTITGVPNNRQFTFTHEPSALIALTSVAIDSGAYAILKSTNDEIQDSVSINLTTDIDPELDKYAIVGAGDNNPFEFRGHTMKYVGEIIENFAKNGVPSRSVLNPTASQTPRPTATVGASAKNITKKSLTSNVATITTSTAHGFVVDDSVVIANVDGTFNGTYDIDTVPTPTTFTYAKTASNVKAIGIGTARRITKKSRSSGTATMTTSTGHGFTAGNQVVITNVDSTFNGTYTIGSTPTSTTFTYTNAGSNVTAVNVTPVSTSIRFDYYIEPVYNQNTYTFSNVFKAWIVKTDTNKPSGTVNDGQVLASLTGPSSVYGPVTLGANRLIFEHPGNIVSISLSENADAASSRTWVVDSGNDLGSSATPYYGSYTNIPYLEEGYPMLETAVTDRNLPTESDYEVVSYAKAIGYRLAPPIGMYKIVVNGSLSPKVNTYAPGDWCTVIVNDPFIDKRLRPPYENRTGLLVRKIASFKVTVPDNPAFPETVDLELIPEWEVS